MPDWTGLSESLRKVARALATSDADADDLVQQTLVTLLGRRPDRVGHPGYARRALMRLWLDRQRSMRRRLRRVAKLALTARSRHLDTDVLEVGERYERVRWVMATLPPMQRAAVVLRLVEELDYAEIAAALDCPVQTVRANLHLGRRRIRRMLGETA